MKNNERNAGRKKKSNEPYTVRCHPDVIDKVRDFAKTESESIVNHLNQNKK